MKYKLLDTYYLEQMDDTVAWVRVFPREMKLMAGKGVYRDDVLVLLFPMRVDDITDLEGVKRDLGMEDLPEWNKTRYLVHMGNANQGYPVQEAILTADGTALEQTELNELVDRIESVFR